MSILKGILGNEDVFTHICNHNKPMRDTEPWNAIKFDNCPEPVATVCLHGNQKYYQDPNIRDQNSLALWRTEEFRIGLLC